MVLCGRLKAGLVVLMAGLLTNEVLGQHLYWSEAGPTEARIRRANPDGTDAEDLLSSAPTGVVDLAIDSTNQKLYWTDIGAPDDFCGFLGPPRIRRADMGGWPGEDLVVLKESSLSGFSLDLDIPAGKLYWVVCGWGRVPLSRIQRSNLDGSEVEDLITLTGACLRGLALDPLAGKMYWADSDSESIHRANVDGSNVEVVISEDLRSPHSIVLDPTHGHLYWAELRPDRIRRANLDGTGIVDVVTGASACSPSFLALDSQAEQIYWTTGRACDASESPNPTASSHDMGGACGVQRANLDGSGVESIANTTGAGIALDPTNGKVYWSTFPGIRRANRDGSFPESVLPPVTDPQATAIDLPNGKLYWYDLDSASGNARIRRCNLIGTQVETVAHDPPTVQPSLAVHPEQELVYWTRYSEIRRAKIAQSSVEDLPIVGLRACLGVAVSSSTETLYWTAAGAIQKGALDGSEAEALPIPGVVQPTVLAIDGVRGKAYWADRGTAALHRADLPGGQIEDLVKGQYNVRGIAIDELAGKLYWTSRSTLKDATSYLHRSELDGSKREQIRSSATQRILGVAMDPRTPPDVDADGDVDLHDVARFLNCFSGAGPAHVRAECHFFDSPTSDGDVDHGDFQHTQDAITGPLIE